MDTSLFPRQSLAILFAACCAASACAAPADHSEFDATLYAPFQADPGTSPGQPEARTFTLNFEYPGLATARRVDWQLELVSPSGAPVQRWQGSLALAGDPVSVPVRWPGRQDGAVPAPGIYQVRMHATSRDPAAPADPALVEEVEQAWDISVGPAPAQPMARFAPMASGGAPAMQGAPGSLPYTVWLGNLHSQTNHSDGGGDVATCKGAQEPQTGKFGPADAFAYARQRGLDMLVASEHNHMFDGSDGVNPDADAAKGRALYQSGLAIASSFTSAHPGFLAIYAQEWGVINNGGHMNIFNSPDLLGWEQNARGELVADTRTPRSDYAALYTLMKARGWIGQFNHPSWSGQFVVNGVPLGYTPDGDEAMTLCEVVNSTAFSTNETETETRRSNFETACNKLLEAGYHVAFSSNQDNHCANWGASYGNRTAVLVPSGTPLTQASFVDALKARRVFATMDKGSQLVLTANGHMMGERFTNSGALTLDVHFASSTGKAVASVAVMEGVPGRKGLVSQLSAAGTTTITPSVGAHFYYAKVTQADGNILWSAPVWVTQVATAAVALEAPASESRFDPR
jgi:hypothetical protein